MNKFGISCQWRQEQVRIDTNNSMIVSSECSTESPSHINMYFKPFFFFAISFLKAYKLPSASYEVMRPDSCILMEPDSSAPSFSIPFSSLKCSEL